LREAGGGQLCEPPDPQSKDPFRTNSTRRGKQERISSGSFEKPRLKKSRESSAHSPVQKPRGPLQRPLVLTDEDADRVDLLEGIEDVQGHCLLGYVHGFSRVMAIRSKRPFTKALESVVPNRFPSSTASFRVTFRGTSAKYFNSKVASRRMLRSIR